MGWGEGWKICVQWKIFFSFGVGGCVCVCVLGGGVHEKSIYWGELPKRGGLGQFADLREAWQERGGGVFERRGGWYPMHNMLRQVILIIPKWDFKSGAYLWIPTMKFHLEVSLLGFSVRYFSNQGCWGCIQSNLLDGMLRK